MSGWGNGIYDFNNDGFKDLFSANSHVSENADLDPMQHYRQANAVFKNMRDGTFQDVSAEAGPAMNTAAAHRGAAFGDLNNDGKVDVVVSVIGGPAELLYNTSTGENHSDPDPNRGNGRATVTGSARRSRSPANPAWSNTMRSRLREVMPAHRTNECILGLAGTRQSRRSSFAGRAAPCRSCAM